MNKKAEIDSNGNVINIGVFDSHDSEINSNWIPYEDNDCVFIGGVYREGIFYPPKPFPSWTQVGGEWVAPKEKPEDSLNNWNEETQEWESL
jgi:hypothetical protein